LLISPYLTTAVDLADDRGILGLARFEQFDDARQTAGDVLGLGGFARDLGQHVARLHLVAVLTIKWAREGMRYFLRALPGIADQIVG
jgi:hypothetical protein